MDNTPINQHLKNMSIKPQMLMFPFEAESVAYVVCQHYGINTSDYSFSYVAGWSEGKETPELKASLDKIRFTAAEFIGQIDEKLEVLMQVQEQSKEEVIPENSTKTQIQGVDEKLVDVPTEKVANPELKSLVDKMVGDIDKKRTTTKAKTSVKSKIKEEKAKSDKTPKKPRSTTKSKKEERA